MRQQARLEVLSMVVNLLFLFALDFAIVVEAVQTLIHVAHMDSMHQPEIVCIVAALGIVLNGTCIVLIGGSKFKLLTNKTPLQLDT